MITWRRPTAARRILYLAAIVILVAGGCSRVPVAERDQPIEAAPARSAPTSPARDPQPRTAAEPSQPEIASHESDPELGQEISVAGGDDVMRARRAQRRRLIAAGRSGMNASVGFYVDIEEGRLRQEFGPSGIEVLRDDQSLLLRIPAGLAFEDDALREAAIPLLDRLAEVLDEFDQTLVTIVDYGDVRDTTRQRKSASGRRALELASYLVERGIEAVRLLAVAGNGPSALSNTIELRLEPVVSGRG